jgi:hypothetical protein
VFPKYLTRIILCSFFSCVFALVALTACSTDDGSKTAVEGELDSELDDLAGDEEKIDGDTTKVAEADTDGDLEKNLQKDEAASTPEDDEFLAEDAPAPKTGATEDVMAEADLEKELDKGKEAPKDEFADFPSAPETEPPPTKVAKAEVAADDEFQIKSKPTSKMPVPDDEPMAPASVTEPIFADATTGDEKLPAAVGSVGGPITSKETTPNDNFDYSNPSPVLPKDDLGESDPLVTEVDPPLPSMKAAQEMVRISKVEKNPFYLNERLMNTVYIARPNDDLGTISQKIYNEDRTSSLKSDNPSITSGVEPGDKIYYTSPNRPDDKKAILNYYEDNKMVPSYYTTQQGDDIQKIGRRVLGYEDAWKEVWAVNDSLQTQALLPAGLKIRYWSGNELKAGNSDAMNTAAAPATSAAQAKEPVEEVPIEMPPAMADSGNVNTEDPGMATSDASIEPAPLLPDSSFNNSPAASAPTNQGTGSLGTVAGIAIVILAVLGLIAIQIKNRKRGDMGIPPSLEFTKV